MARSSTTSRIRLSASTAPACCSTGSPPSSVSRSPREPRAPPAPLRRLIDRGHYLQIVNAFGGVAMPDTTCHMSISLDGFVAGPDQSREHPLGKRGRELEGGHLGDERASEADETAVGWLMRPRGAYVRGRNMFGRIRGEWEEDWRGWWGPEPPYHAPVFVLTHHAREPIEMDGGTTFHFVTGGIGVAPARASEAPGGDGVGTAGGASPRRAPRIPAGLGQ